MRQDDSLVRDFVIFLAQKRNSSATQLNDERILVDDFVVAFSQLAMNLHTKSHELKNLFLVKQLVHSCELVKFVSSRIVQFRVQPHLGKFPVAPHRHMGNLEHFCHLVVVEPAKIFQLDYLSFS